ncbi:sodium/potassium/calcium exchanger 5-like [Saccoglossus kowalevskii]|uniref:Sodium/potassium/calcium exchanger 3-like n=1 Tax=Saccoglossus kowalevskii TaxID=10224 RepID=A0ABM0GIY7_SACKO|nr:PREDICTED: sodium/potassium/calcium exchanger 3-like [Saccoglossus kowalevskii]
MNISIWNTSDTMHAANCTPRISLGEVPSGIFTEEQLRNGAIAVPVVVVIYMLYGMTIACDRYFVPALECICERLNLQEDVAGATFMAFGSSAPEFLTTLISMLMRSGSIGFGTVIGSAAFNLLLIPGIVGLITAGTLSWWSIVRDSTCYIMSIALLIIVVYDFYVTWWEAIILICAYGFYILIMVFNRWLGERAETAAKKCCSNRGRKKEKDGEKAPLIARNGTYNAIDGENNKSVPNGESHHAVDQSSMEKATDGVITTSGEYEVYTPFRMPEDGLLGKCFCCCGFPIHLAMYLVTPDCRKEKNKSWYIVTFVMSSLWMGGFCYIAVWMVEVIGFIAGIPDVLMGLVFLSIGSSLPDLVLSILVAREGHLDMSIANAIGSNVFDILICMGLPCLIVAFIGMVDGNDMQLIDDSSYLFILAMLLVCVFLVLACIGAAKWRINRVLGVVFLLMYVLFIVASVTQQTYGRNYCE